MELLRPYNDKYEEKGIRFVLGRGEDEEEVWRFIVEEFIPDEPVTRSLGFLSGETWVDRYARAELRKFFTGQCLGKANSHSVLALDGSEIVGVKLGFRLTTACQPHPFSYSKWMEYLYWALPQKVVDLNVFSSYYEGPGFRYHPNLALEDLRVDSLFEGAVLCVGREARGLGLGKELLKMSMEIARSLGCKVYYSNLSGIYSQKIYRDLDFEVLNEITYADIKDSKGRTILNDTREHKKAQNVYLRF